MRNRTQQRVDNYEEVRAAIAKRIESSGVSRYLRNGKCQTDSSGTYVRSCFEACGTDCELTVEAAHRKDDTDELGDTWSEYEIKYTVNFPSHGSCDVAVVLARVDFYREVAMLGAQIIAEFGRTTVSHVTYTAEDRKRDKEKNEKKRVDRLVSELARKRKKGLKKGSSNCLLSNEIEGIPTGTYSYETDDQTGNILPNGLRETKTYKLVVNDANVGCSYIERLS